MDFLYLMIYWYVVTLFILKYHELRFDTERRLVRSARKITVIVGRHTLYLLLGPLIAAFLLATSADYHARFLFMRTSLKSASNGETGFFNTRWTYSPNEVALKKAVFYAAGIFITLVWLGSFPFLLEYR